MGHTIEKFKTLLIDAKDMVVSKPIQPRPLTEILNPQSLFGLQEILDKFKGNFTREDLHYDTEGLVVQYHCDRVNRTYTVKITPSK